MTQPDFYRDNRFCVTGGTGFLGSRIVAELQARGADSVYVPDHEVYDLRFLTPVKRLMIDAHPTVIIHAAGNVGGIGYNLAHPADLFYDNLMMGALLMHEAYHHGVQKFVTIGTVCAYPSQAPTPFSEADLWEGYPEPTNAPYGIAKKALSVMGLAYHAQHGMATCYLLPTNLYGEGDDFSDERSHVIPALIRKFIDARQAEAPTVTLWGDGTPTRDFLYVGDAAEAIVLAAERCETPLPVNLGSGQEVRIADLARRIADAVGYTGGIVWDTDHPNGQMRRVLDTQRAQREIGWWASTPFAEGLRRTIAWYEGERVR